VSDFERIDALARLVREKGVNRDVLLSSLHEGLMQATEKEYGSSQEIRVTWEQGTGDITMEALKTVVETIGDGCGHLEISVASAHRIDKKAGKGDKVATPIDIGSFNRASINVFRQEFLSLVRSAEREQVFAEYHDRIDQIIPRCRVQQVYKNRVLVQIAGRIEAIVPAEERARGERYDQGDMITPILVRVESPESTEPQLVLSRATPELVRRLFEREAPEIEEGVVEIRTIAREAGVRTKIAVASNDMRVDAVGTFVGMKGSRVQSVMRELNGERIDVISWTMDRRVLATNALLPAMVLNIEIEKLIDPETGEEIQKMIAVVPNDQLSLAIGKNGHNVRLAGELVGCRIDLETQSDWEDAKRWDDMERVDISTLSCVSDKLAERLSRAGYDSANIVLETDDKELLAVNGVGPVMLKKIVREAEQTVKERAVYVCEERKKAEAEKAQEAKNTEEEPGK